MPRILGVVAEYNPFHNGHAWHLEQARRQADADYVIVVMSTCFTQRGEAALLSPRDRAAMALLCGADAVFALPAVYAVRDAEHFACGGVQFLASLGCDAISFGTEVAEISQLQAAAKLLESPDGSFAEKVRTAMSSGIPYPAAIAQAANEQIPGVGQLLSQPNSTLAVCYLRALLRIGTNMEVYPIQRTSAYHSTTLDANLPSATALRGAIIRGDWASAKSAMPSDAFAVLKAAAAEGRMHLPGSLDAAVLYRLRTMTGAEYAALPDISEGIEHRLRAAAESSCSRSDLLESAKTRRYPYARLSRLVTHALLHISDNLLHHLPPIENAWLLGFRKDAREIISLLSKRSQLPLLTRSSELSADAAWFQAEMLAHDIWALGAGLPSGLAVTQGLAII